MKSLEARLRRHANPKPEEVEEDIERVRRRLQAETQGIQEIFLRFTPPRAGGTRRAIELVVAASFLAAVAVLSIVPRLDGAAAVVEAGDDGLHRIVKGKIHPLRVGQRVDSGEIIRADGASSATLAFDDGSRVEMGPTSELSLDNSRSVLRVHLNQGSIIVSAGKAIEKSFSIQTQDATVSLEDTVSVVAIEQARSRVAVIKGQALVEESGTARRLRSGEEIATGTLMAASRPLIEEVAWSRLIREHLEVLQQAKPTAESERFEVNAVRREKENPGLRGSPVRCNAVDGIFPLPPRGLTAGVIGDSSTVPRGRCVGRYVTLMTLITVAFDVPERNISGGPDWARSMSETFQIEAKAEAISTATKDQLRVMLQKLLEERFKLRIRRDSKEAPGYALAVSPNGPKLQQTSGDAELYLEQNGRRNQFNLMRGGQISIKGRATIQAFANYLSVAPVIALNHVADKTGLPGMYEFSLTLNMVAPEFQARGTRGGGDSAGGLRVEWDPSISKAIEEQLGLSLVSQRVFEEVIVIEHAEKPSDN